jgi:hypothetical protein
MTVTQFCSLTDLSASQVTALREVGVISPDLPPDQAGRARLIQGLKSKGIPLSKLVNLALPPGAAYVWPGGTEEPPGQPVQSDNRITDPDASTLQTGVSFFLRLSRMGLSASASYPSAAQLHWRQSVAR